ncbi:Alpha/Beta hydrolase protein [Mycena crocata]|nr:Alpha/Beta hydrolase protein [Mycena crocata]
MSHPTTRKYGETHWNETLGMLATLIPLPMVVLWRVITAVMHAPFNRERSVKRIAGDSAMRYFLGHLSAIQLQKALGTTLNMYEQWTEKNKLPRTVDELGEDARLMWIGPKRLERVVLFSHGGGFFLPASDFSLSFWRYVQLELEKQNIEVGFALFSYSLAPTVTFPTPLNQARIALEFLLAAGVKPHNLQLVSDSAGANLVVQLLSQMLHPCDGVPEIHLPASIRGVYLISPWTGLTHPSKSHTENDGLDVLNKKSCAKFARAILAGVPETNRVFVDAGLAPEWWFKGVDRVVDRVLITAGSAEILRDDIVSFAEAFKKHHVNAQLVVQKGGLHEDMFLDFLVNEKRVGTLTPLTVEWLAAGFTAEPRTLMQPCRLVAQE